LIAGWAFPFLAFKVAIFGVVVHDVAHRAPAPGPEGVRMSPRVLAGGLIVSIVLNMIVAVWAIQMNRQVGENRDAIVALQDELIQSNQNTEEARAIAVNLRGQVENTGTLTRFAVTAISEQLSQLVSQTITLTVPIDQQVPVATSVRLEKTFEVPIRTTVPINTNVSVPIQLGILGDHTINLPINLSVPIDLVVSVPFSEEIPINATVPIVMDVPVVLSLKDTPLAAQLAEWRGTLEQLGVNAEE
jgi:hypothetical protein